MALLCIVFVVTIITCFDLRYALNDDTGIIGFITGGYPVPYVGRMLSGLLHQAYVAAPSIAWFGLTLYLSLTVSLFIWLMLVWHVFKSWWQAFAWTLIVLACYGPFLVSLDFTKSAAMLCMSGIAWACVLVMERSPRLLMLLLPGLLFMLGMLVRTDCVFGALAYALPVLAVVAVTCFRGQEAVPEARRLGVAALIFLAPAAVNWGIDITWRHLEQTPQQQSYDAFNAEGGKFDHFSRARRYAVEQQPSLLRSIHWTRRELNAFMQWRFLDERIYTPAAMRALWTHSALVMPKGPVLARVMAKTVWPSDRVFPMLMAAFPLFLLLLWRGPRGTAVIGVLMPVYWIGLGTWMYLQYAYHFRIQLPFEVGTGLIAVLAAGMIGGETFRSRTALVAMVASLLLGATAAALNLRDTVRKAPSIREKAQATEATFRMVNTDFAGSVILIQPDFLNLNELNPLEPIDWQFQPINLGWNTFSPRFYGQISTLGITHGYELIDALIDNPHAYLLGTRVWCQSLLLNASNRKARQIRVVTVRPGVCSLREFSR